jgi:hypothetical protein
MEQVFVNVADITQKLRGARVYNEQSNTSLTCSVNSLVMTYLGSQEIGGKNNWRSLLSFVLLYTMLRYEVKGGR